MRSRQPKHAPPSFFLAASQNPFDGFPTELLLTIFCYLEPKQVVATLPLVCKSFRVLSHDPQLWLHFCQTLGLTQLADREGVDPRKDYFIMARVADNIRSHQFVIEQICDFSKAPHACARDLYCLKEDDALKFFNVWSRRVEFIITPQIELAQTFERLYELANLALSLMENESRTASIGQLEIIFQQLSKLCDRLERFKTVIEIIDALNVEDPEGVKLDLQDICQEAVIFCTTQKAEGREIKDLAVNERFCGMLFKTGLVEVYDREKKAIIYSTYYPFSTSIHMSGSVIYTCLSHEKKVVGYDLANDKKRIITHTDELRVLNDHECLLNMDQLVTLYNSQTGINVALFKHSLIVDFCYSAQNQTLAIAYRNATDDWILFIGLASQAKGGYTFLPRGKYKMDAITNIQWQGSFLYVSCPREIKRINPFTMEGNCQTVWQSKEDENVTKVFWCADLLFIQTEAKAEEKLVKKFTAYNYFVTFNQVAEDLILGYRSDDLRHLEMRFHGFTHAQKETICRYLPQNRSRETDLASWQDATAEDKATALEHYLFEK